MKYIKSLFIYFLFSLLITTSLSAKEDHRLECQPLAIEEAAALSHEGILKRKENGFTYLDVTNDFIKSVVPLLDLPGELRVPPTAARSVGAHISVFYEKEEVVPEELNTSFPFEIKEIRSFTNHTRDGLKKHWVIAVNSVELEALRVKYGCAPKLNGHDFHITLGKQMPAGVEGWEKIEAISSLVFSDEPTAGLSSEGDFVRVNDLDVQEVFKEIGTEGIGQLCLKNNGFVYLDADNQYIEKILSWLPLQGEFEPVSTKPKKMGAHISVIHEDEMIGHEIWELVEAGEWFTYEIKELRYVDRKTSKGKQRLWLLAVDSPGLERLRLKYGLKPKLQGHDLHITLGNEVVEFDINAMNWDEEEPVDDFELLPNAA